MAQGLVDSSFRFHLENAKNNGVTQEEMAEVLTHAAFYAGWPKAWACFQHGQRGLRHLNLGGWGKSAPSVFSLFTSASTPKTMT